MDDSDYGDGVQEATTNSSTPSVGICSDQFPAVSNMEVGKTYTLTVQVQEKTTHQSADSKQDHADVRLNIVSATPSNSKKAYDTKLSDIGGD